MHPCAISFLFLCGGWLDHEDGLYQEEDTSGLEELDAWSVELQELGW